MSRKPIFYMALTVVLSGCATLGQIDLIDFNEEFGEEIPSSPQYKIEPAGNRYQVVVYQGQAYLAEMVTRHQFLSRAALIAAEAECQKSAKTLGEYDIDAGRDSFGYAHVLGFFSCRSPQ